MINVLLVGSNGAMGKTMQELVEDTPDIAIIAGINAVPVDNAPFPTYQTFGAVNEHPDVLVDFSHRSLLMDILSYSISEKVPAVLATTGYTDDDEALVRQAAEKTAIFRSMNMSYGVFIMNELLKKAAVLLEAGYDAEIIEAHHNKKQDSPSGTAKMLLNTLKAEASKTDLKPVYGRSPQSGRRKPNEIGMHSLRGGTIVGEHSVVFAGCDEIIKIEHTALSKKIFASGAIKAARFLKGKSTGLYSMSNI